MKKHISKLAVVSIVVGLFSLGLTPVVTAASPQASDSSWKMRSMDTPRDREYERVSADGDCTYDDKTYGPGSTVEMPVVKECKDGEWVID